MLFSRRLFLASASSAGFVGSCGGGGTPPASASALAAPPGTVTFAFNFANGLAGWEPAYADCALGQEPDIAFAFGHERLPAPLDQRSGFYMESHNRSDDVFMYAVRLVDGLAAGDPLAGPSPAPSPPMPRRDASASAALPARGWRSRRAPAVQARESGRDTGLVVSNSQGQPVAGRHPCRRHRQSGAGHRGRLACSRTIAGRC